MNIQEAVKKAIKDGKHITRKAFKEKLYIEPTDTPDCCIISAPEPRKNPRRGWQPQAEDLLADDWIVID